MPRSTQKYHERLRLTNFTVFRDVHLEFVPGVNALVGENGTGKTHLLKALYGMLYTSSRRGRTLDETLQELFQTRSSTALVSLGAPAGTVAQARGSYGGRKWEYAVQRALYEEAVGSGFPQTERPAFIPAIDMMGHTRGFAEAYADVRLDFDLTCSDIVNLLALEKRRSNGAGGSPLASLEELLGGSVEREDSGRFNLVTPLGRLPMPLVAEGLRKIATLVHLSANGWLSAGATLFWDEPEVNLNPMLMDKVVAAILLLARRGVQVFLATHSYVILREIEVQAEKADSVRFFSLFKEAGEVKVNAAQAYLDIRPNPIEQEYTDLYDRTIEKRLRSLERSP